MSEPIDVERCRRAMQKISVSGAPHPGARARVIEDAIASIQRDGIKALSCGYVGTKNYAQFTDQRSDHPYGMGPKHGTIVFEVGRVGRRDVLLGADEIYFLECVRDAGAIGNPQHSDSTYGSWNQTTSPLVLNLQDVLERETKHRELAIRYRDLIQDIEVESHESQAVAS